MDRPLRLSHLTREWTQLLISRLTGQLDWPRFHFSGNGVTQDFGGASEISSGSLANHTLHCETRSNGLHTFCCTRQGICCSCASPKPTVSPLFPDLDGRVGHFATKGASQRCLSIYFRDHRLWPGDWTFGICVALEPCRKGRVGVHRLRSYVETNATRNFSESPFGWTGLTTLILRTPRALGRHAHRAALPFHMGANDSGLATT